MDRCEIIVEYGADVIKHVLSDDFVNRHNPCDKTKTESGNSLWTKLLVPKQGFHNNAIEEPLCVPQRIGSFGF